MLLFTSDLDRTLIYSDHMIKKFPFVGESIPVEFKDQQIITYMSKQSIELLKQINQNQYFVPVTTRAYYQYKRISIFQNEIKPKYAVVCNGGTILVNGKIDVDWHQYIHKKIATTCAPKEDMMTAFARIRHSSWVVKEFYVDDFFYVFHIIQESIPHSELQSFEEELHTLGWRLFLHGKKLYILPFPLDKAAAVARIQEQLDYDLHIAAGDSVMDYSMIASANIGYSPIHGELFEKQPNAANANWIQQNGVRSTEELLSLILSLQKTPTL
ncbi:HAD family hydrolase [Bacillus massiliigorillae]|uniref:HAD family hydrolase n=1 Tax=Bacillus massiliigorillae TaxID=1243664 RepID=UPI0003AAAE93|nr:HAD family hydrolase [Bacillus massiliigorillae]